MNTTTAEQDSKVSDPVNPVVVSGTCAICKKSCQTRCSHCKKVFYCSVDCQHSDRRSHKRDCFPAKLIMVSKIEADKGEQSHWLATREIEEGELIFGEYTLMTGPNTQMPFPFAEKGHSHVPVCLGCLKVLDPSNFNTCSRCKWPVCNDVCQQNPLHSEAECRIFAAKNVISTKHMEEYNMISVLRCVALKATNPRKWAQIMNLTTRVDNDNKTSDEKKIDEMELKFQLEFFTDVLGFTVTRQELQHVTQVWNSYNLQPLVTEKTHCQRLLFYHFNFISHSCLPNTKSLDDCDNPAKFNTYATTRIPKGKKITNSILYGNCMDGTRARRQTLKKTGFICKCERCIDPTELGTYMSAIKCPAYDGNGHSDAEVADNIGFLLPFEPLDNDSIWKCNSSNCALSFSALQIQSMLDPIWTIVCALNRRADERGFEKLYRDDVGHEDYQLICEMENYLVKMDKVLHSNHYFKFSLMKKILIGMNNCISPIEMNPHVIFRQHRFEISQRMQELAEHCVQLSKVILPGLSLFTGKCYYFLATSKWIWITENVTKGGCVEKTLVEMRKAGEINRLVERIFEGCVPESIEAVLLQFLKTFEFAATNLFMANPSFASKLDQLSLQ